MTVFACNNLTKSYNDKILFEKIAFGMEEGDRVGIIGKNGAGKTTLMKIIAGLETQDEGEVVLNSSIRMEYLDQMPFFDADEIVIDYVMKSNQELFELIEEHNSLCAYPEGELDDFKKDRLHFTANKIDLLDGWNFENSAKAILNKLGINNINDNVNTLSGGQKKRISLAKALLSKPDLLILDEPTNHLDADSVQWLQDYLQNSSTSLLFVTHDRYFLDAVSTRIVEIDRMKIFNYPGNYEKYLEYKEAFERSQQSTVQHNLSQLRSELAWLMKGAKARRTKQKSRIDWIDELKKMSVKTKEKKIEIELGKVFLGNRVIEAHYISKKLSNKQLFKDFTYIAKPKDRIGIIGPNGCGKSTFLRVLMGDLKPDDGRVDIGGTIKIGYFQQDFEQLSDSATPLSALREIAEYIDVGVGRDRYITTRELLDRFLFPRYQQNNFVSTLSGGERRRLALLRVFMANPNVLFLDEPTNDFDIQTLNALENYLDDFYGVLIIVSHDRAFLDRTVNFIWSFENNGSIKEYPGNYSYYLEQKEKQGKTPTINEEKSKYKKEKSEKPKVKLSFKEQREYDEITEQIPKLEDEYKQIELKIMKGEVDYKEIEKLSHNLSEIKEKIDNLTLRWLELEESISN